MAEIKNIARAMFILLAAVTIPLLFLACADESDEDDDRCALVRGQWKITTTETALRCEDDAIGNTVAEGTEGERKATTLIAINQLKCEVTVTIDGEDISDSLWGYQHFDGGNEYSAKGLYGIANATYDGMKFDYSQSLKLTFEKDGSYFEGTYEHNAKSPDNSDCVRRFDIKGYVQ